MVPVKGGQSPWGQIDGIERMAEGVVFVSTSSHGGVWLSPERLAEMPKAMKAPSSFYHAGSPWFEEDCEILRVVVSFPVLFKASKEEALRILCMTNEAVAKAVLATAKEARA